MDSKIPENFEGQFARVYLQNGLVLKGRLHFDGMWLEVTDESVEPRKTAGCNVNHIVAYTLLSEK